mmetsp:Transcript_29145/g.41577  ORF Transcript_29145/g.41577 Transcript_29145/m.41577 type:complete len:316 (+) Transcript_29145:142-1089(+)
MNVKIIFQSPVVIVINFSNPSMGAHKLKLTSMPDGLYNLKSILNEKFNFNVPYDLEVLDQRTGRYFPASDDIIRNTPKYIQILVKLSENDSIQNLMIEGRRFDGLSELLIANRPLKIEEMYEIGRAALGTGVNTWDGAIVLAKFFDFNPLIVSGKRILELGAGTGVAGIAAAMLDSQYVMLSDLEYTTNNLHNNALQNGLSSDIVDVQVVDWFDSSTYPTSTTSVEGKSVGWDLVIGADVVWLEHLIAPLVNTFVACMSETSTFYLAHQKRSEESDSLLLSLLRSHFSVNEVDTELMHPDYRHERIKIYFGRKLL